MKLYKIVTVPLLVGCVISLFYAIYQIMFGEMSTGWAAVIVGIAFFALFLKIEDANRSKNISSPKNEKS